ncbi:hypothetical protein N7471_012424 [Penicillium samsonianum]|uniref:uncharacterized protein n=1 Tax=Penicillium samsonianum TaxID=1882272 RepID=UPI002546592B|nr:uncharacterized protein N7471_012424 [Penicillium samsonianum]KAJ6125107.1 hypothetical protein N7471_012424 [Penicillium samsonianum]
MGNGDELMDNSWNLDREGVAGFGWDGIGNDRGLGSWLDGGATTSSCWGQPPYEGVVEEPRKLSIWKRKVEMTSEKKKRRKEWKSGQLEVARLKQTKRLGSFLHFILTIDLVL